MINFKGIFRAFSRSDRKQVSQKGPGNKIPEPLEEIVIKTPAVPVEPQETSLTPYYEESLRLLKEWGIKGEPRETAAKFHTPQQLQQIYSRIDETGIGDARRFLSGVPWGLSYQGNELDAYINLLKDIKKITENKYSGQLPLGYSWKDKPTLYKSIESLKDLKERLLLGVRANGKHGIAAKVETAAATYQKPPPQEIVEELGIHREALEAAGYDFEVVSAIVVKGFNLYSRTPFIGYNYTQERHVKSNAERSLKDKGKFAELFEPTLSGLIREKVLVEPTRKSHNKVYSLNPALNEIKDPALRAFVSYVFSKKESMKRGI
ncbi:hypothetical protein HYX05_01700 [Candidatus Woesearchaeota archaeon]|nr:hypothetical protein [Candidatus Woesearchaeota archaeon]